MKQQKVELEVEVEVREGLLIISNEDVRKEVEKIIQRISNYTKKNKKLIEGKLNNQVEISFSMNFNLKQ